MTTKTEASEFISSRRARLKPEDVGLTSTRGNRRVPGLRRDEVAMLAGVSTDYYIQLERGGIGGASDAVLDALSRALNLDDAEREHLYDLARAATATPRRRRKSSVGPVRHNLQVLLDAMTGAPAWIQNDRHDILATNALGRALHEQMFDGAGTNTPNSARFAFLDPRGTTFFSDWDRTADDFVAVLRATAGRDPHDPALSNLIGELATRSQDFRVRWAAHDIRKHSNGTKRLHHPEVGDLELMYEAMALTAPAGLTLATYTAEPGSASEHSLRLLASWASPQTAAAAHDSDRAEVRTSSRELER
jgi:transcriptional regulator with XRE-family HTH domain